MTRPIIDDIWATGSGRITTPLAGEFTTGHQGYPQQTDAKKQNYLDNRQDTVLQYLLREGIAEWDENETYAIGNLAKRTISNVPYLYYNLTGTNTATAPESDSTNWEVFIVENPNKVDLDGNNATFSALAAGALTNLISDLDLTNDKVTSGYQKINGIIIQWGVAVAGSGWITTTLPIAFPNRFCYLKPININPNGTNGNYYRSFNIDLLSLTQFRLESISSSSTDVRWFAIGY